jgi:hypothetical protein
MNAGGAHGDQMTKSLDAPAGSPECHGIRNTGNEIPSAAGR